MKTIVFVGPPGCGKTTTAGHTFRSGLLSGRKIFLVNDEGEGTESTVDAGILRGIEGVDLAAMSQGCIGCRDEKEFRKAISQIQEDGHFDWLVIEPVGYIAGHEVPNILHSMGIHPLVICLIDVMGFMDNLIDGFMPSQIRAAQAIGLTKYGRRGTTESLADFAEYVGNIIGEYNSTAPIFRLPKGSGLPKWILRLPTCHVEPAQACHKKHNHTQHQHKKDDHGIFTIHIKLKPNVTYAQIREIVENMPDIFRGKGVVETKQWHFVQRKWQDEADRLKDDRLSFATFYSRRPINSEDFVSILIASDDAFVNKTTREILHENTISEEDLEAAILKRIKSFPREALINRFNDLVTHPEILSLTMQLAYRQDVPKKVVTKMIHASVRYWLSAAKLLQTRDWEHPVLMSEWQRRLGIALGWYGHYHALDLGDELMQQIIKVRPAHMLCEGLLKLDGFHSDPQRAKIQLKEIADVLRFGMDYEGISSSHAQSVIEHCMNIAKKDNHDISNILDTTF